jgi:2,5-furandicarboxylate decarboxylase 1
VHAKDAINRQATHSQSMRAFMAVLREAGELVSISQSVGLDYEVAGCLAQIDGGAALHFANVAGASGPAPMPIVGNLLNSLPRFASGLGVAVEEMQACLLAAIDRPLPHRLVSSAPCQEASIPDPSLADELPIPRFFEK